MSDKQATTPGGQARVKLPSGGDTPIRDLVLALADELGKKRNSLLVTLDGPGGLMTLELRLHDPALFAQSESSEKVVSCTKVADPCKQWCGLEPCLTESIPMDDKSSQRGMKMSRDGMRVLDNVPLEQTTDKREKAPHVPAAFINAIADEGTKEEALQYLQDQWNENCQLRRELAEKDRHYDALIAHNQEMSAGYKQEMAELLDELFDAYIKLPSTKHNQPLIDRIKALLIKYGRQP